MSHYSYPLNDERERLLDRLGEETDATESAIRHYLEDKQNRQEHWEDVQPGVMRLLNTSELSVSYYPKVR